MVMAADLSRRLGWLDARGRARAPALMRRARLPERAPASLGATRFARTHGVDKKVLDGQLRLVLLKSLGRR
jgi:3-dehydroquinate synthetase